MNKDFSRNLTLLRKEKNLSQKAAAAELGVSQVLLSHYEKGIRECGLDFIIKAARYYDVSCDYLLGASTERNLSTHESFDSTVSGSATASAMNKRVINNFVNILYDVLAKSGSRKLTRTVTNYLIQTLYRIFRALYSANPENPQALFTVPVTLYQGYSAAYGQKLLTDIRAMTSAVSQEQVGNLHHLDLSENALAEEYRAASATVFNVIQQAENPLEKMKR